VGAIRRAGPADAAALARIRYDFRAEVGAATEPREAFEARCGAWMAARLASDSAWRCWVAEEGGEIVGAAWAQAVEKVPNPVDEPELHVYVTNVYVRAERRSLGTGGALLGKAVGWAREAGAHSVFLWPTPRSRSLYARHGFAQPEELLELVLDATT
jgi:GNAT superfamily N-acetyltransferase